QLDRAQAVVIKARRAVRPPSRIPTGSRKLSGCERDRLATAAGWKPRPAACLPVVASACSTESLIGHRGVPNRDDSPARTDFHPVVALEVRRWLSRHGELCRAPVGRIRLRLEGVLLTPEDVVQDAAPVLQH